MRKERYGKEVKKVSWKIPKKDLEGRSPIEHVLAQILKGLGIRYKQNQYIGGMEVDFLLEEEKLVIEANGKCYHNQQKDSKKANKLYELGYRVIQVWGTDIINRPEKVKRRIRNKARMRGIDLAA
jgi:very-short-patch-repair endonuclease